MTTQEPQKGTMEELDQLILAHITIQSGFHAGNNTLGELDEAGEKIKAHFHHQLQKAREEERERAIEIVKDELRTAPLEVQMTKGIVFASIVGRIRSELDQDISK